MANAGSMKHGCIYCRDGQDHYFRQLMNYLYNYGLEVVMFRKW